MPLVPDKIDVLRQPGVGISETGDLGGAEIRVEAADEGADTPEFDAGGNVVKIEHGDGSVTISLDGQPVEKSAEKPKNTAWFANLVGQIDAMELSRISGDLLQGIAADIESRRDWIEARTHGIALLGIKVDIPGVQGAADGAPVEGMSKVRHPLLLESVLRFQANARSEMLPTDGPVKIRNDNNNAELKEDQMANALERDLNHYLTNVAKEYYPDTDRMLLMLGFGGTSFKKVYNCPLRGRPVSESIDADDLIVNQAATDLANAKRKTHRVLMRSSTVKRLQILDVYVDVDLSTPLDPKQDPLRDAEAAQQGVKPTAARPDDRDREIYECYCELDIKDFEHKVGGSPSGLEIPYRVTIDVSSQKILSIVRNFKKPRHDKDLPVEITRFVKYTFVPGLGFYDIGLLHILGNTTNAITAAWRELLDAGMYACFPGFLISDQGGRQNTNVFRVPPGGGAQIKTGGMKIGDAIMNLPYKEPSAALAQLADNMATTGMRIGGTSEQQVGEGRADAPVGTTLANIEQAVKVLNAVHKRMHAAQAEEFKLLVECFRENPQAFWQSGTRSNTEWDEATFTAALADVELSPQADPNTASSSQRIMKIMALKQLQQANPSMYDPVAIDTAALQAIGWSNPQQFFVPPQAMSAPPPELQEKQAEIANKTKTADAQMITAQSRAAEVRAKIGAGAFAPKPGLGAAGPDLPTEEEKHLQIAEAHAKVQDSSTRAMDAETRRKALAIDLHEREDEATNRAADRSSKEHLAVLGLAKDILLHPGNADKTDKAVKPAKKKAGTVTPKKKPAAKKD
jgi:hypothetical protein